MRRLRFAASAVLIAAASCFAQGSSSPAASGQQQGPATPRVIGHGAFQVVVPRTLESSKLKLGDQLEFPTAADFILPDGTHVHTGSKVRAHILSSESRSKGDSDSVLMIQFDSISIGGGNPQPVRGIVQAVGPNLDTSGPIDPMRETAGTGGAPDAVNTEPTGSSPALKGRPSATMLTPQSTGIHGIRNLELSADGQLTSKGKNVKLESGCQIIVKLELLQP